LTEIPAHRSQWPHLRLKTVTLSWRDLAFTLGPLVIVSVAAVLLALHFVRPAPPRTLSMVSGPPGSSFRTAAEQYRQVLARSGITVQLLPSAGSLENLERLAKPDGGPDVGLAQSGLAAPGTVPDVVSLGSMFYEPLTIFYRSAQPLARLAEFEGRRIAIGAEGSGTRVLALTLLRANGIEPDGPTQLLALEGEPARRALLTQQVNAIFLSGDSASPETIREMLHSKGIRLFDFAQADSYVRRFRYLSKLTIPPGAFDLGENLPPAPVTLLAPTVELLARPGLHPALSDLLIEAAIEVHGRATLLQEAGQFPSVAGQDFPISADAARYYKSGKSFAYRHFPFWLASLLDRALVLLLPIVLVVIPGLRYLPQLYAWRIDRRIHGRYGVLMALEREALKNPSPEQRAALLARLAEIEKSVIAAKVPGSHADQLYVLREHINFVRDRLGPTPDALSGAAAPMPAAEPPPAGAQAAPRPGAG
jgi:TRAP-type uncharacterized transport system substrate-binding protein